MVKYRNATTIDNANQTDVHYTQPCNYGLQFNLVNEFFVQLNKRMSSLRMQCVANFHIVGLFFAIRFFCVIFLSKRFNIT